jgi:hypothetical protein
MRLETFVRFANCHYLKWDGFPRPGATRCLKAFFAVSKHCLAGDEDAKSEEQIATSCCIRGSTKDFIQVIKQQERKEQNKDS